MFIDPFPNSKYKDLVTVSCSRCGKEVLRKKKDVIETLKDGNSPICSKDCVKYERLRNCKECGKEFRANDNRQKYCNRSCAASFNNRLSPKRSPSVTGGTKCPECGNKKSFSSPLCQKCKNYNKLEEVLTQPISKYTSYYAKHNAKWNKIRLWARNAMKIWGVEKKCVACGFDYYVEVCHIKPISQFSETDLMREVNSRENLVYLCPNHHIMLDKGDLELSRNS